MTQTPEEHISEDPLDTLIVALRDRFQRIPTEEEVYGFIYGDDWDRFIIWNKEKVGTRICRATANL